MEQSYDSPRIIHFPKAWRKLEENGELSDALNNIRIILYPGSVMASIRDDSGKDRQRNRLMRSASIFIGRLEPSSLLQENQPARRYYASFSSRFFGPLDRLSSPSGRSSVKSSDYPRVAADMKHPLLASVLVIQFSFFLEPDTIIPGPRY